MSDLTDFLLARIAEDEAVARAAPGAQWVLGEERAGRPGRWFGVKADLVMLPPDDPIDSLAVGDTVVSAEHAPTSSGAVAHIARHDPARVLAECEAKRRVVEQFTSAAAWAEDPDCSAPGFYRAMAGAALGAIAVLAAVYEDHPDYRPEWRP